MYLEKLKLDGRVAVVTGAGQGIGAACARALGEAGAVVIVADMLADRVAASVEALRAVGISASGKNSLMLRNPLRWMPWRNACTAHTVVLTFW